MRTIGFNVTGHPVLALPIGLLQGRPAASGMQIVGPHRDEAIICQLGDAFEREPPTTAAPGAAASDEAP